MNFGTYAQKINGVSFVSARDSINSTHVQPVVDVNANYVSLMPFGFIRDIDSPELFFNQDRQWYGERYNGVKQYASELQKEDLQVMVKPQLWIRHGEYTGTIDMKNEENWQQFEESYCDFILTYAKLAAEIDADIFCIGTELELFVQKRPQFWTDLIKEIRSITDSKLTYASNWDEYSRVPFWDQLDYIGIDAYFPLSDKKSLSTKEIEAKWKPIKKEIKNFSTTYNKEILFTEYGYRSIDFSLKEPWQANRVEGQVNLEVQTNSLEAIHNVFWEENWFAGGFLWKWFHRHDQVGGEENNRFTLQNKPAEEKLKELHTR